VKDHLKKRYRLIRRGGRNAFYCVDSKTGKRTSLGKHDEDEARQIIDAKNQALRQPVLNMQIAKAYLYGTENGIATRTWQQALDVMTASKTGDNQEHWKRGGKEQPFDLIRDQIIIEMHTRANFSELIQPVRRYCNAGVPSSSGFMCRAKRFSVTFLATMASCFLRAFR
jgi:hypothetical protein